MPTSSSRSYRALYPEIDLLGLTERQIYPAGDALSPAFLGECTRELIGVDTPVASIGSCFARELKDWLVARGFNYVQTATGPNARHGSAAWDRVYNTFNLLQEARRALACFEPSEAYWEVEGVLWDPYRKAVVWRDHAARDAELATHVATARRAFMSCDVLIITLGLTEIWYARKDGAVFFQVPPRGVYDPERHAFRDSSVGENTENVAAFCGLVQGHNPGVHIILTVSPIPLRATFQPQNVLESDALSKAKLLVAAREVARLLPYVEYFPAFEIVKAVVERPFEADNRHVRREVVEDVMYAFSQRYMVGGAVT